MTLTREQLRAIHAARAAKEAGLSKRAVFATDVAVARINRKFTPEERERKLKIIIAGSTVNAEFGNTPFAQPDLTTDQSNALFNLSTNPAAKKLFLKKPTKQSEVDKEFYRESIF